MACKRRPCRRAHRILAPPSLLLPWDIYVAGTGGLRSLGGTRTCRLCVARQQAAAEEEEEEEEEEAGRPAGPAGPAGQRSPSLSL